MQDRQCLLSRVDLLGLLLSDRASEFLQMQDAATETISRESFQTFFEANGQKSPAALHDELSFLFGSDDRINFEEYTSRLYKMMATMFGDTLDERVLLPLDTIFDSMDLSGSGTLTYEEFTKFWAEKFNYQNGQDDVSMEKGFIMADVSASGEISREEFRMFIGFIMSGEETGVRLEVTNDPNAL